MGHFCQQERSTLGLIPDRDMALLVVAERRDVKQMRPPEVMTLGIRACQVYQAIEHEIHLVDEKSRPPVLTVNDTQIARRGIRGQSRFAGRSAVTQYYF